MPQVKLSAIILLTVIVLQGCKGKPDTSSQQALMEASKMELATAVNERDRLISLIGEITSGMDQIKHLENILTVTASQPEQASQRQQILADISSIRSTLRQRREQLTELEAKLKESALYNDKLQYTIDAMRTQIENQSKEIDHLNSQLMSANEQIGNLSVAVDSLNRTVTMVSGERDSTISAYTDLENEANTCYYTVATKSELKKHKIIETGFLRKTILMKGDFDRGFFVISDKRNLDSLNLTHKARILTNHPEGSYNIKKGDNIKTLIINNPDQFWSISNFLVIQSD